MFYSDYDNELTASELALVKFADDQLGKDAIKNFDPDEIVGIRRSDDDNSELSDLDSSTKQQAIQIYNDVAGRGHGRKATIQRFIDALDFSHNEAKIVFKKIKNGEWS